MAKDKEDQKTAENAEKPKESSSVTGLIPVKFLVQCGGYNAGETAGFEKKVADDLVDRKIAEPVKA